MQQITLLDVTRKTGLQLSPEQMRLIGMQAGNIYRNLTGEKPLKVPQAENGLLMQVNAYPQEFEVILNNLVEAQYALHQS